MPPRVAYWTVSFEPDMEALASEVQCLRRAFPGSVTWGVNPRSQWPISIRHGLAFHPRFQLVFRGFTALLQHAFEVNHVFGSMGDWYHLRAIHRRPTLLTVAVASGACSNEMLAKVDLFAIEWPDARDELKGLGIECERIRLVFPPVDLKRFQPTSRPNSPFTVLFATSPERSDWLDDRGVGLLLAAAKLRPDWRFVFVWRPWGDALDELRRRIRDVAVSNVEVVVGRFANMTQFFGKAHVTAAPFLSRRRGKPAPNSIVESLACGRPVVVTNEVGLSPIVTDERIGAVCETSADSFVAALEATERNWDSMSISARRVAEKHFGRDRFIREYDSIYRELLAT